MKENLEKLRKKERFFTKAAFLGALFVFFVFTLAAQTAADITPTPHGLYQTTTSYCQFCHEVHGAAGNVISRKFPEIEMCYTCHDGTGSTYNIRVTYKDLAAHDTKISLAPRGIKCLNCHYPHGTGYTWMTRESEENLCFKAACHDNAAHTQVTTIRGWNIYSQFKLASYHAITSPTADGLTGAKVECSSCHGPHTVQHTTTPLAKVSNPENTYKLANASGTGITLMTDFCLKCHDGTWPEATYTSTTFVPYTITFPDMPSASYPFFTGWNKAAFTSAGHYVTTGTKAYCNTCHHPHGSNNARLTAYNYNNTSTYAEEKLCYACHGTTPATGADNIQSQATKTYRHPVGDYTGRHRDTEMASGLGSTNRHAECVDCHDPHLATSNRHVAPGNLASGVLKGVVGVEPNPWPVPNVQPRNIPAFSGVNSPAVTLGAGVSIVKAGDFFYAISGGSVRFWRYNPSNNTWQLVRDALAAFGDGAALVWTGGDFIYATRGANTTTFWKYKISTDTWNPAAEGTPAVLLGAAQAGSSLAYDGTYIYYLQGAGTRFDRYTIPVSDTGAGSWTARAVAPATVGAGGSLIWTGGDFIYAFRGAATTTFYRYSISGNSWATMTVAPLAVGAGGSLLYIGSGDFIYAFHGGGNKTFWSYSIANNNWTTFDPTDAPATIGTNSGNRLVYDGSAYIYALRGVTNGEFWRYRIATNLWNDGVAAPTSYIVKKPVEKEYQLCLKCHSNYTTQPTGQMNLAEAINPMTVSHHPIAAPGANRYCDINTMEPPWNQQDNGGDGAAYISPSSQRHDLMYCSDCHGSDVNDLPGETTSPADPLGPHGSNVSKLLRAPIASNVTVGTPLCYICHKKTIYWTTTYVVGPSASRHSDHPPNKDNHKVNTGCLACHMGGSGVTGGKPASYKEYTHGSNIVTAVDDINRGPAHGFLHGDGIQYVRQADMRCWTPSTGYCGGDHEGTPPDALPP